jgi:hypothetical protein
VVGLAALVFAAALLLRGEPLRAVAATTPETTEATEVRPPVLRATPPAAVTAQPAPVVAPFDAGLVAAEAVVPRRAARQKPLAGAPVAPAAVDCNPPFFFDAQGNRVFKTECL